MSIDGEVCAYVRGCKNKKLAIDMAAIIFGISDQRVISALQSYGLLDENRKYIEPVRMTGMEVTMGKKGQKINYPAFQWSQKRQKMLREEYQAGAAIPEIAEKLGTDEDTVYQGIAKFDLVKVTQTPPVEATALGPATETASEKTTSFNLEYHATKDEVKSAFEKKTAANVQGVDYLPKNVQDKRIEYTAAQSLPSIHATLKDLLHYTIDASNHNNDTMAALDECKDNQAFFELGQQCVKLSEAEKIIKKLLQLFLEP